ncbi:hypothetical protein LEP1GSC170_4091 [Leptospira interrogans serovar Bataviae str. HAI135]|nr:hypothetical protein LEP1GSC170_4091 [Leptospira interrogans serovar Bataviae str. HAI135]
MDLLISKFFLEWVNLPLKRSKGAISKLTKSDFITGLQCEYLLWLNSYQPHPDYNPFEHQYISPKQKSLLRDFSHSFFPNSKNVRYSDLETRKLLKSGKSVRSACLETEKFIMKTEYILPNKEIPGTFEIVILKVSGSFKKQHIPEIAFQRFVAEEAGFRISKCSLLFVNSKFQFEDEIHIDSFLFVKTLQTKFFLKKKKQKNTLILYLNLFREKIFLLVSRAIYVLTLEIVRIQKFVWHEKFQEIFSHFEKERSNP